MGKGTLSRLALVSAAVMLTSACLAEDGDGGGTQTGGDKRVEIVFGFGGEQSEGFQQALADFQQESGITITFTEASQSFDTLIRTRVRANNPPDIALFPQPGILKDFVDQGKMTDLSTQLDVEELQEDLVPGVLDAGKVGDKFYGVPVSMNVKSLVFYPRKAFESKGYETPKTQQELLTLTSRIESDGTPPWCLGIESGAATGWPATDWIEEYVLRIGGPEKYDQWVNHEIPFNDPLVQQAARAFENLVLDEGNVFGGRGAVASTAFATAANPMFNNPPRCFLHRQGNFITQRGFFPDAIVQNLDEEVGVFYFPGQSEDEQPVLGGGDLAAVFSGKDEDTRAVMQFMTSADFPGWSEQGGFLSPRKDYDLNRYESEVTREIARIGYDATVFRFDGSDQMPGAVGSGSFWRGMVAWISGQKTLDASLTDIERTWPD